MRQMWHAPPTWGAPRIVGERRTLGIEVAQSTVEHYRPRPKKSSSPPWQAWLQHPGQELGALDCFVVPTGTCRVLLVRVMLAHDRRRSVHCNVTEHPTAPWTAPQVVEAFPWDEAPRSLLRDRARISRATLRQRVKHLGITEGRTAPQSPGQHPSVDRRMGSIRRACLAQVIVRHAQHVQRLLTGCFAYDHAWRPHRSLAMDGPKPRPIQPSSHGQGIAGPEVGGLHHHYERVAA